MDVTVITAIIESQFKCARSKIAEAEKGNYDSFINVRFKHIGSLYTTERRLKKIDYAGRDRNSENS